jgi:L-lactate dehydrogenase complex protein LldE
MRVALFPTCLVDQIWPSVGVATTRILRRVGCEVVYDERMLCCGQPAFNSGYPDEARRVAQGLIEAYESMACEALILPSGSCGAMLRHLPELWDAADPLHVRARHVAEQTHELGTFLVNVLEKPDVGASFAGKVTWHDACHGLRELGIRKEPRALIQAVRGTEFVEMEGADSCCGFGGTFSVKFPEISVAILDRKLEALSDLGVDALVSGDVSCLMQVGGRLERIGSPVKTMHLAELLAGTAGATK